MVDGEIRKDVLVREIVHQHFPDQIIIGIEENKTGLMHLNYAITFFSGQKIFYRGQTTEGPAASGIGPYFGDSLSLEREVEIIKLLGQTTVPVPEIYACEEGPLGSYALLSYLEGVHLHQYLKSQGHDPKVFLEALRKIGRTLASTNRVTFAEFGDIQPTGISNGCQHWADRLQFLLQRHETNPRVRSHFNNEEWCELKAYIDAKLGVARTRFTGTKPQIVIYDLHARNFNVYPSGPRAGDLSGVFDVEFAQAAHPSLELGGMSLQIFSLYGMSWFARAKEAFLVGHREGGGEVTECPDFEDIYLINHALSAVGIYDGRRDGVRDHWSDAFKQWSLDIARGVHDPAFIVELTRPLHRVPRLD